MIASSVAHESFPPTPISPSPSSPELPSPICALCSVSYPYGALDKITLYSGTLVLNNAARYTGPKLFLFGGEDEFSNGYENLIERLDKEKLKVEVVEGMDHFWANEEGEIVYRLKEWLSGLGVEMKNSAPQEARL